MQAKADLHVHSLYSNRPSEWILRRIGAPESFVPPREIYRRAQQRGMTFFTITDHNSIAGALEIADQPNTFLSAEITTYFPEDGCKVHILTYGLTEASFAEIQDARENIYDLRELLLDRGILHSVAHPLFSVNDRLSVENVERLLVLFKRFEVLNGTRPDRANRLAEFILSSLEPDHIELLANRYDIDPRDPEPWRKFFTGGSDDHSGVYVASAYTVTPPADNTEAFLQHLREGDHRAGGRSGTSLSLGHSFYHIAYSYYKNRLLGNEKSGPRLLDNLLRKLLANDPDEKSSESPLKRITRRVLMPVKMRGLSDTERRIVNEFSSLIDAFDSAADGDANERTFHLACRICHQLSYHFLERFIAHVRQLDLIESLQTFASLAPVTLSVAPYLAAFMTQHKDEPLLRQIAQKFAAPVTAGGTPNKKAWFTDTCDAPTAAAKAISRVAPLVRRKGYDLTIVTSMAEPCRNWETPTVNFPPVGCFDAPEYAGRTFYFPPFLNIIEYLEREDVSELVIWTPGPLGLVALAAGRILGLKVTGIYDTDYPGYVESITEDDYLRQVTWRYICWFYGQMDRVCVPSEAYRKHFRKSGLTHRPIEILPSGVDNEVFNPRKRDEGFWQRRGCSRGFTFLYVGSLSQKHHVDRLLAAFSMMRDAGGEADLAIVSEAPDGAAVVRRTADRDDIVCLEPLRGADLAAAYASADVFVCPGPGDPTGRTILEAHASGLPAIVVDGGAPADIVRRYKSGIVVRAEDGPEAFADAMGSLLRNPDCLRELSRGATAAAAHHSWSRMLEILWSASNAGQRTAPPPLAIRKDDSFEERGAAKHVTPTEPAMANA